jgi:hypothetical protein
VLPTAALAVSNANPHAKDPVTFDASGSTDPDSAISGYDWDFDGNGTVDRTTTDPKTDFAYPAAGSFTPTVAVKDFRGGSSSASAHVTVSPPEAGPPGPPGPGGPGFPAPTPGPRPSLSVPSRGTGGKIRPTLQCQSRCRMTAKFVVSSATARKLGLSKRTLATFTRTFTTTKKQRFTLKLPARIRAAAKRAGLKSLRGTLTVKVKLTGGRSRTVKKVVRIRL